MTCEFGCSCCCAHTKNDYEDSEYYKTYLGPNLTSVEVDGVEDVDLFNKMKETYGENNNWNGKLYRSGYVLPLDYLGKTITYNFISENGRKHWTKHGYKNQYEIMNPPLFSPLDQKSKN